MKALLFVGMITCLAAVGTATPQQTGIEPGNGLGVSQRDLYSESKPVSVVAAVGKELSRNVQQIAQRNLSMSVLVASYRQEKK